MLLISQGICVVSISGSVAKARPLSSDPIAENGVAGMSAGGPRAAHSIKLRHAQL